MRKAAFLMMTAFFLLFSAGCMEKAADPDEHPSAGMIEGFHRLSYYAGTIAAATEFVGAGAKKLALSSTYTEEEFARLAGYASREAEKHGVAMSVERDLLVTRLFRPDIAKDKIVIMFAYTEEILEEYRALKEIRAKAVEEGNLEDIAEEIAWKFGKLLSYADEKIIELLREQAATYEVEVRIGDRSRTFTLNDLRAFPKARIADYEAIGVKKGPLGRNTWAGARLKDVLLEVDPTLGDPKNGDKLVILTCSDGWVAVMKWAELFGSPRGGEALYNIKGCNECHGVNGEGTAPEGKLPAPDLADLEWDMDIVKEIVRTGGDIHADMNPYTEEQLSDTDLLAILDWLKNPEAVIPPVAFTVDPAKMVTLLAYEKNGQPMTGKDGLIQLIVGMDEYSSRYSHWVARIEIK